MKRFSAALVAAIAAFGLATAGAQDKKVRLSIGTGGTGGVYYPLGGGLAALISKYVPGVEATAEVTAGSIAKDRKSTRLNSSHQIISYAVFCLKKKNKLTQLNSHVARLSYSSHL